MGLGTWILIGIIGFLILSSMFKDQLASLPFASNLPFMSSDGFNVPSSVQDGIDFMEQDYGLPLWIWAIIILFVWKMNK